MEQTFFLISIGILGLIVGSFLNVVIYRLPLILQRHWRQQCLDFLQHKPESTSENINLFLPRSRCPHCKHLIRWQENIPLLSFLWLRMKCRHCHKKISWRYPVVELSAAILGIITANHFGISWQSIFALLLTWALIVLFFIDLEHFILPDEITLSLVWVGLLLSVFHLFITPENAIIAALIAYLSLCLIGWGFKKIRGLEGLGYGDYKLFAAFGAWMGWQALLPIILVASVTGLIIGLGLILAKKINRKTPIPFGPFLALAGWLVLIFGGGKCWS